MNTSPLERPSPDSDILHRLGVVGRWPWLARLLKGAAIGAWIRNPTLRLAWVAFILSVPGMLTLWTIAFALRQLAARPRVARRLAEAAQRARAAWEDSAEVLQRALVVPAPVLVPWSEPAGAAA